MALTVPASTCTLAPSRDVAHFNAVANHPDVRPALGGDGPLDLTAIVTHADNLAFATPHGGFVGVARGEGRYEVHSLFLPAGRGREAITAMREGAEYLFTRTDAVELLTKVPESNRAAAGLARLAGFRETFTARVPWAAGEFMATSFQTLPVERWALGSATARRLGEWLHDVMEDAKAVTGSALPPHSEDEDAHIRLAGAALAMSREGHVGKGVTVYNRWAVFAGYPLVQQLLVNPPVVDLGEGLIVALRGTELEILQCQ
jgi:hypothetical protein